MLSCCQLCCHLLRLTKKMLNKELAALVCYLKGIDLRACSKTAVPVFQAMSRPELLKVLAAETSQRDGDTDDITANFVAQVQALHNNAPATKAKAKASNKANIIQGLKTAKSSSSKVASKASRKIWHGALKKKRQDCPALREGDTHEKGNVLVEVPEEVEAVTPNPWQRRVVRRTHSVCRALNLRGLLQRPRLLQKSGQPVWRRTTARLLQKTSQPVWRTTATG